MLALSVQAPQATNSESEKGYFFVLALFWWFVQSTIFGTQMTMAKQKQSLLFLFLSVVSFGDYAKAQDSVVGVDICACQPAVYEITLDFEVACKSANVGNNDQPGILETACRVTAEDTTDVTDFVPAAVQEIQFLELNAKLQTLQQEVRRGSFRSNDKVQYTSVLAVKDEFDEDTLPAAVQVNMRGVNSIEQPLQMYWIIKYDNDCGVFPLLEVGQKEGWSIFVSIYICAYTPYCRGDLAMPRYSILMPKVLAIAFTDGSWFATRVRVPLGGR